MENEFVNPKAAIPTEEQDAPASVPAEADNQTAGNEGVGKPEPLKGNLSGIWSRRIDAKNRLVYRVTDDAVEIIQCRGHY